MSSPFTLTDAAALIIEAEAASTAQKKRELSGETAANKLPVRLNRGTSAISRPVLSSPLFGFRKDPVRLVYTAAHPMTLKAYPCVQYGDCVLSYQGEELRQDDQRVLAGVIEAVRGREIDVLIKVNAREFCKQLGWGPHHSAVVKLSASIQRLYGGSLRVKHSRGFFMTRFLDHAKVEDGELHVRLHRDMLSFFEAGYTYLPMEGFRQLTDGFATWMYAFLKAHSDETCFELAALKEASGSTAELPVFGQMVRATMQKMLEAKVVGAYDFRRGRLLVSFKTVEQALGDAK